MLRPIILLITLSAGGGAAWIASQETAPEPTEVASIPEAVEMTGVLVAAQDVPRGSQVTAAALKWQQWPADTVPSAMIDRTVRPDALEDLVGRYANRPLSIGEPVTEWTLSDLPNGFMAASLAPGQRAVAINVDAQSTAGGFILPNDRVDVLHTVQAPRGQQGETARSRTILRGVRVLAIDQTSDDVEAGTVLGKTATLELSEAQVEAVTAAASTGTLSLSLRPMEESPGKAMMVAEEPTKTIRVRRGNVVEDTVVN